MSEPISIDPPKHLTRLLEQAGYSAYISVVRNDGEDVDEEKVEKLLSEYDAPRPADSVHPAGNLRRVYVALPELKAHDSTGNCADSPIVGIEIMRDGSGKMTFWANAANAETETFGSLGGLCNEYGLDMEEIVTLIATSFVLTSGEPLTGVGADCGVE